MANMKCILGVAVLLCVSVWIEESEAVPPGMGRVQRAPYYQRKWPSDGQNIQVPVSFRNFTSLRMDLLLAAVEPFHESTCISFMPHTKERDYLNIDANGCSSLLGRQYGAQRLSLNCESKAEFQRELLHSLGFSYEPQRPDRDQYIRIHWDNIQKGKAEIFMHMDDPTETLILTPYDYRSVMHFPSTAFSANGKPTLEAVAGSEVQMGSEEMTEEDIKRVNQFYCPGWKG